MTEAGKRRIISKPKEFWQAYAGISRTATPERVVDEDYQDFCEYRKKLMNILDRSAQEGFFKVSPTVVGDWRVLPFVRAGPDAAQRGFRESPARTGISRSPSPRTFETVELAPGQNILDRLRANIDLKTREEPVQSSKQDEEAVDLTFTSSEDEERVPVLKPTAPVANHSKSTTSLSSTSSAIVDRLTALIEKLPSGTSKYDELVHRKDTQVRSWISKEERQTRKHQGWLVPDSEVLPELDPEALAMIRQCWSRRDSSTEVVQAGDIPLTVEDLRRLQGKTWLNDECINGYLQLVQARDHTRIHMFNTFFYPALVKRGYSAVQRWSRRFDLFSKELIIIPVHLGMHWTMSCIDMFRKQIMYIDSFHAGNQTCLNCLWEYLESEHQDKKGKPWDSTGWAALCLTEGVPKQLNGYDCGVFTCVFGEFLARRAPFQFSQADMPYFRQRIVYELLTQSILSH